MANPNRLFDFVEESEHFDYVFVAAPRKRDVLGWVDVLDVHQKNVRDFHQFFEFLEPFALARERRARSVNASVDSAFLRERKKFEEKIDLRQWLAAARRDAALFSPIRAASFGLVQKAFRGTPLAAFHFPSVGVVAEFAAQRAACEKNYIAHSRPVHCAKRFDFVDVSVHVFILTQISKMGKCKMGKCAKFLARLFPRICTQNSHTLWIMDVWMHQKRLIVCRLVAGCLFPFEPLSQRADECRLRLPETEQPRKFFLDVGEREDERRLHDADNPPVVYQVHFVELEFRLAQHRLNVARNFARFLYPLLERFVREPVVGNVMPACELRRIVVDDFRILEEGKSAVARLAVPFAGEKLHLQPGAEVRLVECRLVMQVVLLVRGIFPCVVPSLEERAGIIRVMKQDDTTVDVVPRRFRSVEAEFLVPREEIIFVDMLIEHDMTVEDTRRIISVFCNGRQVVADNRVAVDVKKIAVHIVGNGGLDETRAFCFSRVSIKRNCADFRGKSFECAPFSAETFFRHIVAEDNNMCLRHLEFQRPDGHECLLVIEVVFGRDEDIDVFHDSKPLPR